jgi:hypothetical protein
VVSGLLVVVVVSSGDSRMSGFFFSFSRGCVVVVEAEGLVVVVVEAEGLVVVVVEAEGLVVVVVEAEGLVVDVVDVGGVSNVASTTTLSMIQYAFSSSASAIMNRMTVLGDA